MKKKEIGIGLCGYGAMGRTHAYALAALPYYYDVLPFSARIVAVHTAHADSAQTAAQALSCRAAATLEELLCDPAVDVVDICTPNHTHFSVAKEALAAKKAIYMEKPLCVGAAQARELAALATQSGACTQVVFNNRYLSAVLRAKELIDGGRLGRLLSFHFAYRHQSAVDPRRTPTWKQDAACGGGVLRDLGPHILDLCVYLCGPVARAANGGFDLCGRGQIGCPTHPDAQGRPWQTNADEAFYGILRLANGASGTIEVSKLAMGEDDGLTFAIYGTKGAVRFDLMQLDYLEFFDAQALKTPQSAAAAGFVRIPCVSRYPAPAAAFPGGAAPGGWLRGHVGAMHAFLTAYAAGEESGAPFSHGAYIEELIEALYQSDGGVNAAKS